MRFSDKVVVVNGGTSGIGGEVVKTVCERRSSRLF